MSKKIKGLAKLNSAIEKLKSIAEEVQENVDAKNDWLYDKTDDYQESEDGEEWREHLDSVESLLDDIDNIEPIGQ